MYRCSAANVGGEASAELRLVVTTPLHVEISPPMLSVHIGGTAEFKCKVETSVSYFSPISKLVHLIEMEFPLFIG